MLKSLIFLSGVIYLLTCSTIWAAGEDIQLCNKPRIGYKLLELDDLDQYTQPYYKANWEGNPPGNVIGDFNGDGVDDCAALFIEQGDGYSVSLSITLNRENGMEEVFLRDVGPYKGLVFISPVKNGMELSTSQALDYEEFVKLEHTGIRVTYFGKAEVVYFWSNEHQEVKSIQTSD